MDKKINIIVSGSNGQLGSEIKHLSRQYDHLNFRFTDVDDLDICKKQELLEALNEKEYQYFINCAAYTAVDKAETDGERAFMINADAPGYIAEACLEKGVKFVHISTDYVFNGHQFKPYREDDPVCANSVYGKSKEEGERRIINSGAMHWIIRTSWLYSSYGHNFVKTMLKYGREKDEMSVVFDQIGTPTYAENLADALLKMINHDLNKKDFEASQGIYHYSNEGVCSWYDFARSIFKLCDINCLLHPIESKDYPVPAPRPFYSVMNKAKIRDAFKIKIPHWEEALQKALKRIS